MMQNQNQVQSQYSSTVRSGTSVGGRRGGRGSVDAQLYGQQRSRERGVGSGEYDRRTFRGKSKRSVRYKEKGIDEEEADEYRVEEDEEEDEDEGEIEAADENQRIIKSKQKKFRKLSRIFALSESVFSILCVGTWETDIGSSVGSPSKKVIMNKRERAAARNAEGTCLRTFVLPFALSDVVEGCLLVGGKEKDAFAATTGERSRC